MHSRAYFTMSAHHRDAGVEVPIWIDLLRVSGLLRLRLLLDPAPPFVRTGTMSFPVLPQIDISARPLKRSGLGSINALKLPGLKTYVLSAITRVAAAFVSPSAYTVDLDVRNPPAHFARLLAPG